MPPHIQRKGLDPGTRVCVAVSGGADSVALLSLLHAGNALPRNAFGLGISAVHVHHGLRGEDADADQAFVEALCAARSVPLHVLRVDTASRASAHGETLEEAGRSLRYAAFCSLLDDGAAEVVATAHTLDDQAETVLMKLLRGAWTEGLSGIHPVVVPDPARPGRRILRPLLATRRADLRSWLEDHRQPWHEDASNADVSFTRNRLRHSVLPVLRAENPALDEALANMAMLAREDEARWSAELARVLPQLLLPGKPVRGGGRAVGTGAGEASLALEVDRLRPLDAALRRRVLRAAARQMGARLSFDETARLLAFCGFATGTAAAGRPGAALQLAGGLRAERSSRELRLSRAAAGRATKTAAVHPTNGDGETDRR